MSDETGNSRGSRASMGHLSGAKKTAIITSSWDDGHPLDLRLAELLTSHGMRGTFYVPIHNADFPVMTRQQMKSLTDQEMEIGAHTYTHAVLPQLTQDAILHELVTSKTVLEDVAGQPITSFCYPKGKFNRVARQQVRAAGYSLARTTLSFRIDARFDPFLMPTSFQFVPHTVAIHVRHAVKEWNLKGLLNWWRDFGTHSDLVALVNVMFQYILRQGGILHIWGHSWEIEQENLWDLLDEVLSAISHHPDVLYLTNAQTVGTIRVE